MERRTRASAPLPPPVATDDSVSRVHRAAGAARSQAPDRTRGGVVPGDRQHRTPRRRLQAMRDRPFYRASIAAHVSLAPGRAHRCGRRAAGAIPACSAPPRFEVATVSATPRPAMAARSSHRPRGRFVVTQRTRCGASSWSSNVPPFALVGGPDSRRLDALRHRGQGRHRGADGAGRFDASRPARRALQAGRPYRAARQHPGTPLVVARRDAPPGPIADDSSRADCAGLHRALPGAPVVKWPVCRRAAPIFSSDRYASA